MFMKSATLRMPQRRYFGAVPRQSGNSAQSRPLFSRLDKGLLFSCISLLIIAVWLNVSIRNVSSAISGLKAEKIRLEASRTRLEAEMEKATSRENLARLGKRLGLHAPGPGELAILRD